VDVSLTRGHDDPQMIFESLNSTGLDLTQADLIRNFVLMRLDDELQTRLYEDYWRPIEVAFGNRYRSEFDKFCRDFLALKLKPSKQFRADAIYHHFRDYFLTVTAHRSVEDVLSELRRYANYYVRFSLGRETDAAFAGAANRLRGLVEVASPLMLRLHDCHERSGQFDGAAFKTAIELLESYIFRRSACDMQTRSLYQIFASIAYKIRDNDPLLSLKVALYRGGKKRRFPSDIEFRDALETRDVYAMRTCAYLLDRLENDSKEKINTSTFTIEHVLPQNENLLPAWREMLGDDWKTVQETWLHRLGNLTLTGYNTEYSDRSFDEKKQMAKGFNDSPLRLNRHAYTEDQLVEQPAIGLFAALGWQTVSAMEETFGAGGTLGRETKGEVVLVERLRAALTKFNPGAAAGGDQTAIDELTRDRSAMSLEAANREVYRLLKDGIPVSVPDREHGGQKTERLRVVDWEQPEHNDFLLVSQFSVTGGRSTPAGPIWSASSTACPGW
jgi:hypothetical protein